METRIVKEGVNLKCSFGTNKSQLRVPEHRGAYLQGGNQAIVKDSVVDVNIFPFKYCKKIEDKKEIIGVMKDPETDQIVPVRVCEPKVALDWINGQTDFTLKGELALLNICIVPCMDGGIISIDEDAGQS